jgi:adenylate cyclase
MLDKLKQALTLNSFKDGLNNNFEPLFVLAILLATTVLLYFVNNKIAFLNFFFLPIILAAYYLGQRRAMLGAVFCFIMVLGYLLVYPDVFVLETTTEELHLHLVIWGGFLILAGAVVGKLQENLKSEVERAQQLNTKLEISRRELSESNAQLLDSNQNLEARVHERTLELQDSKSAVEELKSKVEKALYSAMDSTVVNLMIEGRLRNEKRMMSVMFADLVGFTSYSENIQPENVVAELNRYLQDMEPVLLAYHGHIDKYLGDGIMCEFGAPQEFLMHRLMAVTCAVKMQKVLSESDYPWKMRIGISSGSAIAGLIGSYRQTYTAIGDIVNLASRLEGNCEPGNTLIDRSTHEAIHPYFETRKLRNLSPHKDSAREKEQELDKLYQELIDEPNSPALHFRTGIIHMELGEPEEALQYFETALKLEPGNNEFKISYAEAGLKIKEQNGISVKGKRQRVEAYEVIRMKDPLSNREKIPQALHDRYRFVGDLITIPDDVTLHSEVIDGSVGQSRVVAFLSFALADHLGLPENDKLSVLQAGFLADIGKELIPPNLRNRRGGISATEFSVIKQHPEESCRLMKKMGYDNPRVLDFVRFSHEHFSDNGGYPGKAMGEEIPLGARIIAVADTYDALTSWRPYREPWERHAALGEIRHQVEKGIYDPVVVAALSKLIN